MDFNTFLLSCFYGDEQYVSICLKTKPDFLDRGDAGGFTGLLYAAIGNRQEMVRLLLGAGANPFILSSNGDSAIGYPIVVFEIMYKQIKEAYSTLGNTRRSSSCDMSKDPVVQLLQGSDARAKCGDLFFMFMNPWEDVMELAQYIDYYTNSVWKQSKIIPLPDTVRTNRVLITLLNLRFSEIYDHWESGYMKTIEKVNELKQTTELYGSDLTLFTFISEFKKLMKKNYNVSFK